MLNPCEVMDGSGVDGCDGVVGVYSRSQTESSGPAEPNCAAALPATDAAGVVVLLYLLDLPICRPARWVLGWVSSSLAAAERCVGPGRVLVDGLVGVYSVEWAQEMVVHWELRVWVLNFASDGSSVGALCSKLGWTAFCMQVESGWVWRRNPILLLCSQYACVVFQLSLRSECSLTSRSASRIRRAESVSVKGRSVDVDWEVTPKV